MTDVNSLLGEAEDARNLQKALVQGRIEVARRLVHESLPEEIWKLFSITKDTPRANITPFMQDDQAFYNLLGFVEIESEQYPYSFQIQIGNDCELKGMFVGVEKSDTKIGLQASTKLKVATDLAADNSAIQKENRSKIVAMLGDAQRRIQGK
jgi:capsular polysaccharide biosynthesis protein